MNDKIEVSRSDFEALLSLTNCIADSETLDRCRALLNAVWVPQDGESCYLVLSSGISEFITYTHTRYSHHLKQGRIFKTRDEVEWFREYEQKQAPKLRVLRELILFAIEFNGDWEPDWNDVKQVKYSIHYDYTDKEIVSVCNNYTRASAIPVFKSNPVYHLKEKFGNRLKVLFEVE